MRADGDVVRIQPYFVDRRESELAGRRVDGEDRDQTGVEVRDEEGTPAGIYREVARRLTVGVRVLDQREGTVRRDGIDDDVAVGAREAVRAVHELAVA